MSRKVIAIVATFLLLSFAIIFLLYAGDKIKSFLLERIFKVTVKI